jgi:hypothetical protein
MELPLIFPLTFSLFSSSEGCASAVKRILGKIEGTLTQKAREAAFVKHVDL